MTNLDHPLFTENASKSSSDLYVQKKTDKFNLNIISFIIFDFASKLKLFKYLSQQK